MKIMKIILYRNEKPLKWFTSYYYATFYIKHILRLNINDLNIDEYALDIYDGKDVLTANKKIILKKIKYYESKLRL